MPHSDAPALRPLPREEARDLLCGDAHAVPDTGARLRQEDHLEARPQVHLLGTHLE